MRNNQPANASKKLTQIRTETRHEIGGRDQIDRRRQRLQRQLETPPDLLLADLRHRADLLERSRHALLPARDVQTGGRLGVVRAALQVLAVVHLLEQIVGAVDDRLRQIDAIGHRADLLEGGDEGAIGAGHRAAVLVFGGCGGVKRCWIG